ncbi:MAG TPA: BTAD domain-containing putative transcriptional regulator, partial [Gemmatimonadaceae bacterium]|nr:BTAD domain-containing putative transcriptional regulator [Gemmatimonadaceae bacterium]
MKLFGAPAIELAGGLVTGRGAQGHRLALLAVLALARGRPVTRDKLLALLWPESSPDRARHQLSDGLYIVRSALGPEVIRSAGDDLVLNPDAITSDVGTFEQLLDEGRPEDAVSMVVGPLMDGFHLSDGAEFERWLDEERARLAARYSAALETLAETSEGRGDFVGAASWWRRLAAHDPYGGRVALRLMRALDAAGDRAGALKHARIHATLLREEFDAEPDPDVTAFAERLRVEPPTRGTPEPVTPSLPGQLAAPALATPSPASTTVRRASPARRYALGAAAVLLVVAIAAAVDRARTRGTPPDTARSLAVLPFVNMSPDSTNDYFSDGLSEEIITALSHVDGLRVAARTSSFALRDGNLDVRVIGDTLDVDAVLEGSVRREGNRLRVIAQLIDAKTGYHIWADDYDREMKDVIAVQYEIAKAIAEALELRFPGQPGGRSQTAPNLAAYDLYLRALFFRSRLNEDALEQATYLLDSAIALQPDFALAYAIKTSVVGPRIFFRYIPRDQGVREMRADAERALELDPELAEAHVARGIVALLYEWDWETAERSLRRAIQLNPNYPHGWYELGTYLHAVGRFEEAAEAHARAAALDPLDARAPMLLAVDYTVLGRFDDALAQYERMRQLDPSNAQTLGLGPSLPIGPASVYLAQGRNAEAVDELLRVAALRRATDAELAAMRAAFATSGMPGFWRQWLEMDLRQSGPSINPLRVASLSAAAGDTTRALDWLERAYADRIPGLAFVRWDTAFAGLRSHPRYLRIIQEMNFP